jgi:hypothetical protein
MERGRKRLALVGLILPWHKNDRQLAHELGGNPVDAVICAGQVVS